MNLKSITEVAKSINPKALFIIETTVPPGTCENAIAPILNNEFRKRFVKMIYF